MSVARFFPLLTLLLLPLASSFGQSGTAEPGYSPLAYGGDTWTGEVTQTKDDTMEITLTYKKKDKEETFTGVLIDGYRVRMSDETTKVLKPSDIPVGMRIKVYYMGKTRKVDGRKIKYHEIFRIKFNPS